MSLRSFFADLFSSLGFFRKRSAADLSGCSDFDYDLYNGYFTYESANASIPNGYARMDYNHPSRLSCAGRALNEARSGALPGASAAATSGGADFWEAWRITREWEGPWESKAENFGSTEENYGGSPDEAWWGTNYGLTGGFMRDFIGWTPGQKRAFQTMTSTQCGEIWKNSRWKWARLGEIAKDRQPIASLMFDWGVRRWNSLTRKPLINSEGNITGYRHGLAECLGVEPMTILQRVGMTDVGGKPGKSTDGFYILRPEAIRLINSHPNPKKLFECLKEKRMELDKPTQTSIKARYNNFEWAYTKTKTEWEKANVRGHRPPPSPKMEKTHGFYI